MTEAVFYALFRVVEIEELSGPEKAVEWARGMVDDPVLRRAFGDGVVDAVRERDERAARGPGESVVVERDERDARGPGEPDVVEPGAPDVREPGD